MPEHKTSVTPEELIKIVSPFLIEKMMDNSHKGSPFKEPMFKLLRRQNEELCEKGNAFSLWSEEKTDARLRELILEICDCINFEMFQIGQLLGLEVLERGDDMKDAPRGIRNNNPGNVRHGDDWDGLAEEQTDESFCTFVDMAHGIRAMTKILITYRDKHNLKNPEQVIKRWAPASENDTKSYIRNVERVVPRRLWNLESKEAMTEYIKAICTHENGVKWASHWMRFVDDGVSMAV